MIRSQQTTSQTYDGVLAMYTAPYASIETQYCLSAEHRPSRIGLKQAGLVFALIGRPTGYREAWIGIPLTCAPWKSVIPRIKPNANAPLLLAHRIRHGDDAAIHSEFKDGLTSYTVTVNHTLLFSLRESPGLSRPCPRCMLTLGNHPIAQSIKALRLAVWPWHTQTFNQKSFRLVHSD